MASSAVEYRNMIQYCLGKGYLLKFEAAANSMAVKNQGCLNNGVFNRSV